VKLNFYSGLEGEFQMNSRRASVSPLALFLKPQPPAEGLAAQQRDRKKLQRERQLKELQEEEAKARGEAGIPSEIFRKSEACGTPAL